MAWLLGRLRVSHPRRAFGSKEGAQIYAANLAIRGVMHLEVLPIDRQLSPQAFSNSGRPLVLLHEAFSRKMTSQRSASGRLMPVMRVQLPHAEAMTGNTCVMINPVTFRGGSSR